MKSEFRVLYIGAVECSRHCLLEVLKCGVKPVAVFCLPPDRAKLHSDYADLSDVAAANGIPHHWVEDVNAPENAELITSYAPDVIFVWGWSRIVREHVLKIPRLGCIGLHPALLPANRGRHPIVWAILLGLKSAGLTFFWMDAGADSGDILAQQRIDLGPDEDARSLYDKVKLAASDLIPQFLPCLADGTAPRLPQDHSRANTWRKRGKGDGAIDFRMSAATIARLVRALTRPYVGAHVVLGEREAKVWRAKALPLPEEYRVCEFGRVVALRGREIAIRTGDDMVVLLDHEIEPLPAVGDCL